MGSERGDLARAARREAEDAQVRLSGAAGRVRQEALSAGSTISALVFDELDRRGSDLSDGLRHIAEKMRIMADSGDGEPPRMVEQAVDVIDDLSKRLRAQSARDLSDKVARFGRENPMPFMTACLVTGVLAGRFLIAQSDGGTDQRHVSAGPESGDSTAPGDVYGQQEWQGRAGRHRGDGGDSTMSEPPSAGWQGTSGFAAGGMPGSAVDDAPSDLDLGPDDVAGPEPEHRGGAADDSLGGPGRGGTHG